MDEESIKYYKQLGRQVESIYRDRKVGLSLNTREKLEKGIVFYERALSLVTLTDRSKENRIDDVELKPGKENELHLLIKEMDEAGLLE